MAAPTYPFISNLPYAVTLFISFLFSIAIGISLLASTMVSSHSNAFESKLSAEEMDLMNQINAAQTPDAAKKRDELERSMAVIRAVRALPEDRLFLLSKFVGTCMICNSLLSLITCQYMVTVSTFASCASSENPMTALMEKKKGIKNEVDRAKVMIDVYKLKLRTRSFWFLKCMVAITVFTNAALLGGIAVLLWKLWTSVWTERVGGRTFSLRKNDVPLLSTIFIHLAMAGVVHLVIFIASILSLAYVWRTNRYCFGESLQSRGAVVTETHHADRD